MYLSDLLTLSQAAKVAGVSVRTIQNHMAAIPHERIGREVVFTKGDLQRWIDSRKKGGGK